MRPETKLDEVDLLEELACHRGPFARGAGGERILPDRIDRLLILLETGFRPLAALCMSGACCCPTSVSAISAVSRATCCCCAGESWAKASDWLSISRTLALTSGRGTRGGALSAGTGSMAVWAFMT
jgi:hypothetical protein